MSICSTGLGHTRHGARVKPLAVTVRDALIITGLGNTKIYELMDDGTLKTKKVGGRRLIIYESIERMLGLLTDDAEHRPAKMARQQRQSQAVEAKSEAAG